MAALAENAGRQIVFSEGGGKEEFEGLSTEIGRGAWHLPLSRALLES